MDNGLTPRTNNFNAVYWKNSQFQSVLTNFVHLYNFVYLENLGKSPNFFVWKVVTDDDADASVI